MPTIDQVVAECASGIEASHAAREQALAVSRSLIRQSANTIRAVHRREFAQAHELLAQARLTALTLRSGLSEHAELLYAGYTQDALKEYAEAALVVAFLSGAALPTARELGVEAPTYLNGLAEAASELRRAILDDLRRGDFSQTETLLAAMDDVYSALVTIDYPDAVTSGLRRTTDALRAVLERTRGDVTAALRQEQLTAALAALERKLAQLP